MLSIDDSEPKSPEGQRERGADNNCCHVTKERAEFHQNGTSEKSGSSGSAFTAPTAFLPFARRSNVWAVI